MAGTNAESRVLLNTNDRLLVLQRLRRAVPQMHGVGWSCSPISPNNQQYRKNVEQIEKHSSNFNAHDVLNAGMMELGMFGRNYPGWSSMIQFSK